MSGKWAHPIHVGIDYCLFYLAEIIAFVCAKVVIVCTPCSSLKVLCGDQKYQHLCVTDEGLRPGPQKVSSEGCWQRKDVK